MSTHRPVTPRLWRTLTLAGAAAALTTAAPAFADQVGFTGPEARIWLAQTEGGEGGEAGAVAGLSPDVAYLAQLSIVEGHLIAALDLYRKGMVDEAVGLSYHPEAEMMDEVRSGLETHGVADITPAMTAFSEAMERGAAVPEVETALATVQAAIAAAAVPEADELRTRFDAVVVLLRAAANEYTGSIEGGEVGDVMAYHEAHAFVEVARNLTTALLEAPEAKAAAEKALAAMQGASDAFGDMSQPTLEARDPGILIAVAARVELAASSVR